MKILYCIMLLIGYLFTLNANTSLQIKNTRINLMLGDITRMTGYDAIVNAANTLLSHGGGVALAISQAAGPQLQKYSFAMPSLATGMGEKLTVGQAVVTPAFNLEKNGVKLIIHAVGPQITTEKPTSNDEKLLYNAYFNSLLRAKEHHLWRIAFPSISTAIFGYDIQLATPVAKRAITDFIAKYPDALKDITFVLFTRNDYQVFEDVFLPGARDATTKTDNKSIWQRIINFINTLFS